MFHKFPSQDACFRMIFAPGKKHPAPGPECENRAKRFFAPAKKHCKKHCKKRFAYFCTPELNFRTAT
jgi:hypothetical protein